MRVTKSFFDFSREVRRVEEIFLKKKYMAIPKFNETMFPILSVLSDGKKYKFYDLIELVDKKYFELSQDEKLLKDSNGATAFWNKIWWWKSYLKQAWLIKYPERWYSQITEEGIQALKDNADEKQVSVEYLKNFPSFLKFITPAKKQDIKIEETEQIVDLSPIDLMELWYEKIKSSLKQDLLDKVKEMNPYKFESLTLQLFKKMWYGDTIETSKSWDGWIDGIINEDELWLWKIYIQCKRFNSNNVREPEIRNFIWAMSSEAEKGIFITTSDFHEKAIEKAKNATHSIVLINGERLVELMIKFNIWVQIQQEYILKEIDYDFFET